MARPHSSGGGRDDDGAIAVSRIHDLRDRDDDASGARAAPGALGPRASRRRRPRRHRTLPPRARSRRDVPVGGPRLQGRRPGGARRGGHALPVRPCDTGLLPRSMPACDVAWTITTTSAMGFHPISCESPRAQFRGLSLLRTSHARADFDERPGRRHLRRSFRHAGDGAHHHGADEALGVASCDDHDGLRHVGDRLRLRGRNRPRAVAARNARTGGRACGS